MKTINFKIFGTIFLLSFSLTILNVFAGSPIKRDDPNPGGVVNSSMSLTTSMIDLATPVTYDILGSYLAVSFNSPDGTAVVTIENKNGNIIYQSVVDTNTQSELLIPIKGWKTGTYTLSVSSESTNFISAIHL